MQINKSGIAIDVNYAGKKTKDLKVEKHDSFLSKNKNKIFAEYKRITENGIEYLHEIFTYKNKKRNLKEGFELVETWEVN